MNRFWVFPIVLALAGALFAVISPIEGIAPFLPLILSARASVSRPMLDGVIESIISAMSWGAGIGLVFGLIAGGFDVFRNGRTARRGGHLAKNIAWCLLYVHAVIVVDMALVALWVAKGSSSISIAGLTVWLPSLLWLVAIVWGTVRTIATGDVLSPRVLGAKLRRSTGIED